MFADEQRVEVEATWGIYERIVIAYHQPAKILGGYLIQAVIDAIRTAVPSALVSS